MTTAVPSTSPGSFRQGVVTILVSIGCVFVSGILASLVRGFPQPGMFVTFSCAWALLAGLFFMFISALVALSGFSSDGWKYFRKALWLALAALLILFLDLMWKNYVLHTL